MVILAASTEFNLRFNNQLQLTTYLQLSIGMNITMLGGTAMQLVAFL